MLSFPIPTNKNYSSQVLGLLVMIMFGNYFEITHSYGIAHRATLLKADGTGGTPLTAIAPEGVTQLFLGIIFLLVISVIWTALLVFNLVPPEDEAVTKIDAA